MAELKKEADKVLAVAAPAYLPSGGNTRNYDGITQKVQDGEWKQTRETE